jgi:hypothetical protein
MLQGESLGVAALGQINVDHSLAADANALPLSGAATLVVTPATVATTQGGFAGLPAFAGYAGPPIRIPAEQAHTLSPEKIDCALAAEPGHLSLTGKPARLWKDSTKRRVMIHNDFILAA